MYNSTLICHKKVKYIKKFKKKKKKEVQYPAFFQSERKIRRISHAKILLLEGSSSLVQVFFSKNLWGIKIQKQNWNYYKPGQVLLCEVTLFTFMTVLNSFKTTYLGQIGNKMRFKRLDIPLKSDPCPEYENSSF